VVLWHAISWCQRLRAKTGGIQVYSTNCGDASNPAGRRAHRFIGPDAARFDAASDVAIERVGAATLYLPTRQAFAHRGVIERHQPELVLIDPAWPLGLLGPHSRVPTASSCTAEVAIPGRLPFVASSLRRVLTRASVAICAGGYPRPSAPQRRRVHGARGAGPAGGRHVALRAARRLSRPEVRASLGLARTRCS